MGKVVDPDVYPQKDTHLAIPFLSGTFLLVERYHQHAFFNL